MIFEVFDFFHRPTDRQTDKLTHRNSDPEFKKKNLPIFGHCPKGGGGSEKSQTFYQKFSFDIFQWWWWGGGCHHAQTVQP